LIATLFFSSVSKIFSNDCAPNNLVVSPSGPIIKNDGVPVNSSVFALFLLASIVYELSPFLNQTKNYDVITKDDFNWLVENTASVGFEGFSTGWDAMIVENDLT